MIRKVRDGWARVRNLKDGDGAPIRVLSVGGAWQSVTYVGERWCELAVEYYRAFDCMFEAEEAARDFKVRRVLMIGGAGCSYPKHLAMTHDDVRIDAVEADAAIADIARSHFFVDRLEDELREREGTSERFNLIVDDGLAFLRKCAARGETYDVIINDAFEGSRPADGLMDGEALALASRCLTPGGLYMQNVVVDDTYEGSSNLRVILDRLKGAFRFVYAIPATDEELSDRDNYIAVGSDVRADFGNSFTL